MGTLEHIQQLDLRMLMWCRKSCFYPQFMFWVRIISKTGDGYMQVVFPLIVLLLYPVIGVNFLLLVATAFAIERPLYFVLKNTLKRRRPPEVIPGFHSTIQASDHFSFPSGHTMGAFLLATLAALVFSLHVLPLFLWATAVGASRVILGVHFPSDILAGAIIGSVIGVVTHSLLLI